MTAKTLFDPPPPAVRDSPTSVAAGESMAGSAALIRSRVLAYIYGHYGATCDECEVGLGLRHQTASARCTELCRMGLIVDSGITRKTRSGRAAVVWIARGE
jgi:hypothetical protein